MIEKHTLASLLRALRERRLSAREAAEACIARIRDWQPRINAFIAFEYGEALAAAERLDAAAADALSQALKVLEREGAIPVEVEAPDIDALSDLQMIVMQPEASSLHANGLRGQRELYERGTREIGD